MTESGIDRLDQGIDIVRYVQEVTLVAFAIEVDGQIVVAILANGMLIAVSIWQIGGLERERIRYRLWRQESNCNRGDGISICIEPCRVYKSGRASVFHLVVEINLALAESGIDRLGQGIDIMCHVQEVTLVAFAIEVDGQIVVAILANGMLIAIGIWQIGGFEEERIRLSFWFDESNHYRSYLAGIGVHPESIAERNGGSIDGTIVFIFQSLAERSHY